jgi:hypothetical protein
MNGLATSLFGSAVSRSGDLMVSAMSTELSLIVDESAPFLKIFSGCDA